MKTGQAGADRRGLWVNDRITGTRVRLGDVGLNMAATLTEQGNFRAARQALSKPHVGVWVSKPF